MAIRNMRFQDDEVLRKRCRPVDEVNDAVRRQLDDMMDTLHATDNGAALAAPQVGILRRLVVIDYEGYYLKLVNPVIVEKEGEQECIEGCLSFPNVFGKTMRPMRVVVEALNEMGESVRFDVTGDMAKCFCHEIDHLDGKLFVDEAVRMLTKEEIEELMG